MSREERPLSGYPNEGQADCLAASAGGCEVTPNPSEDINGAGVSPRVKATSGRSPASNSGRPKIDWNQAYLFYAALPFDRRTYRAVAEEFEVSVRTVETHGRTDKWREGARQLDKDASASVAERIHRQRVAKSLQLLEAADAIGLLAEEQAREGKMKVVPRDLAIVHKLRSDLWAEADATFAEPRELTATTDPIDPGERRLQVVLALRDAGVLSAILGLDDRDGTPFGAPKSVDGRSDAGPRTDTDDDQPNHEHVP